MSLGARHCTIIIWALASGLTLWGCTGDGGSSSRGASGSAAAGSTAAPPSQPGPQPQVVPVQETFPGRRLASWG